MGGERDTNQHPASLQNSVASSFSVNLVSIERRQHATNDTMKPSAKLYLRSSWNVINLCNGEAS